MSGDELCDFCEERPPTHFNTEWDAMLCDECANEQDRLLEAAKYDSLEDIFPGITEAMEEAR